MLVSYHNLDYGGNLWRIQTKASDKINSALCPAPPRPLRIPAHRAGARPTPREPPGPTPPRRSGSHERSHFARPSPRQGSPSPHPFPSEAVSQSRDFLISPRTRHLGGRASGGRLRGAEVVKGGGRLGGEDGGLLWGCRVVQEGSGRSGGRLGQEVSQVPT